jgi:hypothetical protein
MYATEELDKEVQTKLHIMQNPQELGTTLLVDIGHACVMPSGKYAESLPLGCTVKCECGRRYEKRLGSSEYDYGLRAERRRVFWTERGITTLAKPTSRRPRLQGVTVAVLFVSLLLALVFTPLAVALTVDVNWLFMWFLTLPAVLGLCLGASDMRKAWRK